MLNERQVQNLADRVEGAEFRNRDGDRRRISFGDHSLGSKVGENWGKGQGIRGLGWCSCEHTPWPLTHIHEETDEYIIACCDHGCATILLKNPPIKKVKKTKSKDKMVITKDGRLEKEKKKTFEDNIFE